MIRLALLRHGHTAWNRAGRIQGRTDIPLDVEAREGLSRLRLPERWQAAALVSSPLSRAVETATLVAGRAPDQIEALQELHWGAWEGATATALLDDPDSAFGPIEGWGWAFCPPGGESLVHLRARVFDWADSLTQDTVAVTHIGVMRVLLAVAHDWHFKGKPPFAVKRNRLFVLQNDGGTWRAEADTPRLVEADPCG